NPGANHQRNVEVSPPHTDPSRSGGEGMDTTLFPSGLPLQGEVRGEGETPLRARVAQRRPHEASPGAGARPRCSRPGAVLAAPALASALRPLLDCASAGGSMILPAHGGDGRDRRPCAPQFSTTTLAWPGRGGGLPGEAPAEA